VSVFTKKLFQDNKNEVAYGFMFHTIWIPFHTISISFATSSDQRRVFRNDSLDLSLTKKHEELWVKLNYLKKGS